MMRILDFDSLSPEEFLNRDIQAEEDVSAAVDEIIREVRRRGDEARRDYTPAVLTARSFRTCG